jgi:hypothetical protein
MMSAASVTHELNDDDQVASSPFRSAFGRARIEALTGTGSPPGRELEHVEFEYLLVKRRKKRPAEEAAWNELGQQGWELVGVTDLQAAFKRHVRVGVSR